MSARERADVVANAGAAARELVDVLLERMTDAFIALDREWRVVYINTAAMGLNARPRPDVIGRSHWEEWPHTVGSEVERQYRLAMETQRPVHFEHHYVLTGADYWHSIHAYPDASGLSIFYRDITEQKRADELSRLLASAGARFAEKLDLMPTLRIVAEMPLPLLGRWSCVYVLDAGGGRVVAADGAAIDACEMAKLQALTRELTNSGSDGMLPLIPADGEPALIGVVSETMFDVVREDAVRDALRALAPQSLLCVPLVARGRSIGGMLLGSSAGQRPHDARDALAAREVALPAAMALESARLFEAERQARRDAEEAQRRAEDANRSKVEFLRAMSHELRTPLNAIGGYAQLLRMGVRGELTPQQRKDVERIERNLNYVTHLISDVMSFARLETGRVELECRRVPVKHLLLELESYVAPQVAAEARSLTIRPCAPDIAVCADVAKATQVLVNLVGNALKHTPAGTTVDVFCDETPPDAPVRICVHDTGPGIPSEQFQAIFEPFVQLGRKLDRPVEGLGLGLAIARDLARRMNGELTVESRVGSGTTFTLVLPRA